MDTTLSDKTASLRELAHSLDCLTEGEIKTLTGWAGSTAKAYRKRGTGPSYIRCGKNYIYPRSGFAEFMSSNTRERKSQAKNLL